MKDFINNVFCMDNLELLKQLPNESIDLIYCDILYNTGKKFKDYDDNLGTPQQAMEWYRPRLIEMKRVLKNTGSIYLQMDYRLVHYMKVEMDNIFEIDNFRNDIIWFYDWGGRSVKQWGRKHDNILFYSKSKSFTFNTDNIRIKYKTNIKNRKNPLISPDKYNQGKIPTDVWDIPIIHANSKERIGYNTQKPKELLKRIILASSNEGDTVADFFMGSGTTLVVAKELGRNYIGCDINSNAVEITKERLRNVE